MFCPKIRTLKICVKLVNITNFLEVVIRMDTDFYNKITNFPDWCEVIRNQRIALVSRVFKVFL